MSKEDKIIPLTIKADASSGRKTIPEDILLWQKYTLSVEETARYFRIGRAKLRKLIDENVNAPYILWNGNRPHPHFTPFLHQPTEKLQIHLKSYNFPNPFQPPQPQASKR